MALKTIFPEEMMNSSSSGSSFSLESIAGKLEYYYLQLRLLHWQTTNEAEHTTLGELVDYLHEFTDKFVEHMIGYTGKGINSFKVDAVKGNIESKILVKEIEHFAHEVYEKMEELEYCKLEILMQKLSGRAAQTLYKLRLS